MLSTILFCFRRLVILSCKKIIFPKHQWINLGYIICKADQESIYIRCTMHVHKCLFIIHLLRPLNPVGKKSQLWSILVTLLNIKNTWMYRKKSVWIVCLHAYIFVYKIANWNKYVIFVFMNKKVEKEVFRKYWPSRLLI